MENKKTKKSLKWLWIVIALVVVAALATWCIISAINNPNMVPEKDKGGNLIGEKPVETVSNILNFSNTFVLFVIAFVVIGVGYLLGGINVKGVTLGTAGVFLVAILVGYLCTLVPADSGVFSKFHLTESTDVVKFLKGPIQNIGLIMFVGSVGFIAGPNFFKNLAKNFKTYIVLGIVIILTGTLVAVLCTLFTDYGPEYWAGVLSGALTSTPGFSAAKDAADASFESLITLGHAIAYPMGVVGVVLFVQLLPKFLKADLNKERELLKIGGAEEARDYSKFFKVEDFGFMPFALAVMQRMTTM